MTHTAEPPSGTPTHAAPTGEVSVASLNLRFGIRPYTEQPFDVTAAIGTLDADVVALQEVWRPKHGEAPHEVAAHALGYQFVDLRLRRAHNKSSPPYVRERDGMHGTWWGVSLLSRRPILDEDAVDFRPIRLDAADRRALVARIDLGDGRTLRIVTPHLTYRLWASHVHLRALARAASEWSGPTAILGDFNMWGPVVARFLPDWQRPVRGRTWPAHRPHSQIDHVLVSPELAAADATVLPEVGSDHRPVRVRLRVGS
jgi:endonuclease/exonuclease/phosphatase family metal-dependent hydrolase